MILPHLVGRCEKVLITWSRDFPDIRGRDLDEIAEELGLDRAAAAERLAPGGAVYFQLNEEDVQRVIGFSGAMIGSDGLPDDKHPHPRLWGTFPRVLGHYARDVGLMPLAEAVHRMSGLPAAEFGLKDRGAIRSGAYADVTVFDPLTVKDTATFEAPMQPAAGIELVLVNGQPVWQGGQTTGERPGRPIRLSDTTRG